MPDFTIGQGDTSPTLEATLTYSNGAAVDLTGASVTRLAPSQKALTAHDYQPRCKGAATMAKKPRRGIKGRKHGL